MKPSKKQNEEMLEEQEGGEEKEHKTRKEILIQLREEFIKEDEEEPFNDREYVEETLKAFDLLAGDIDIGENRAYYDIVQDIFKHLGVKE